MVKFKKAFMDNWGAAVTQAFIIVTLIYFIVIGDGIYLQVHDNLDSNVATYKLLKDYGLYWTTGTEVPFLGGIDRNYLYSDLKFYTWLHMIFPNLAAIIIGWYLKIAISIAGFVFLGKTIYGDEKDINIFIACGLIHGILPTFPTSPYDFASLPFLMAIMIRMYRKWDWRYIPILLVYPVLSDFSAFGLFICGYMVLFFIIDWIVERKPAWRFLASMMAIVAGYVITEWRLFYIMLFSNEESIRATFVSDYYDWGTAFKQFVSGFVFGQYHSGSSHTLIVLPACFLYFVYLNYRYIREKDWKGVFTDPFNWIMVWQGLNCVVYAIDGMKWFDILMGTIIPPLKGFNFSRTLWFSPFLWYFAFMIILCRVSWKTIAKFLVCGAAFVVVCLYPNTYNHIVYNCVMTGVHILGKERFATLSYGEFYSPELFEEIKEDIGYNGEWSIAYGMHPSVINYNDIASLDGYLSYYSKDYKEKFRTLIEPDFEVDPYYQNYFDTWGGRAYIFSKDVSFGPYRTSEVMEADMLIDADVFREMGGKYVFSRVEISNADALGIEQIGVYENEKSPYTIYVYETR